MARTSGETLSTSFGRPSSLARYISPSNSSRTGQKSFSNASRLEKIAVLPVREDALQFSNEGLTLPAGVPRGCCKCRRIRTRRLIEGGALVRGHEDRQAKAGEVMQRLVDADQRPEPGMLLADAEMRGDKTLGAV